MALFFFMMVFMDTTATIPTGAMAERWAWKNFCLYGLWVALPYCIYANWVWGGGWLAQGGINWGLGHGAVDFAGSGVVHAMGGIIGLAGAHGHRAAHRQVRRTASRRRSRATTSRWSCSAPSSSPSAGSASTRARRSSGTDLRISFVVVNTMLASITGAIARDAHALSQGAEARPDDDLQRHARRPGGDHRAVRLRRSVGARRVIGVDRRRARRLQRLLLRARGVDDLVGAISVHGVNGLWGVHLGRHLRQRRSTARAGTAWCARSSCKAYGSDGVRGLLYGDASQLVHAVASTRASSRSSAS